MNEKFILEKLKSDLSYMFTGTGYFTYHTGWVSTFASLCREIDAILKDDKRDFRWVQIKEKYGSARFYFEMDGTRDLILDLNMGGRLVSLRKPRKEIDDLRNSIAEKIDEAQKKTATECIVCGARAKIELRVRWLVCLCDTHRGFTRDEISAVGLT